jgi:hypothetical protein
MRWTEHVAHTGEMKNSNKVLVQNLEGKRPHGKPRCRWKDKLECILGK